MKTQEQGGTSATVGSRQQQQLRENNGSKNISIRKVDSSGRNNRYSTSRAAASAWTLALPGILATVGTPILHQETNSKDATTTTATSGTPPTTTTPERAKSPGTEETSTTAETPATVSVKTTSVRECQ
jgi:hypothetical protein